MLEHSGYVDIQRIRSYIAGFSFKNIIDTQNIELAGSLDGDASQKERDTISPAAKLSKSYEHSSEQADWKQAASDVVVSDHADDQQEASAVAQPQETQIATDDDEEKAGFL